MTANTETDSEKPTVNSHEVVCAFAAALNLDAARDEHLIMAARLLARETGTRCEFIESTGRLHACYPPQRGRKPSHRRTPARSKGGLGYSQPTERIALARITGDERRRAAREERLAAAEARQ